MVYIYFRRAVLPIEQYNRVNFFTTNVSQSPSSHMSHTHIVIVHAYTHNPLASPSH